MPLIKSEIGLLEEDNFYLTSHVSDFLGDGVWTRTKDSFTLKSGTLKRNFPYKNSFMIEVKKNSSDMGNDSSYEFFIENNNIRLGIVESSSENLVNFWRLIYYNNFFQIYESEDGLTWTNQGGCEFFFTGDYIYQGFKVTGEQELIIEDYKVFKSPYLKLQNFKPNSTAQIFDKDKNLIEQKLFDENYECEIFLNYSLNGYLKVFDANALESPIFASSLLKFDSGDTFIFSNDNEYVELIYKGKVLDYRTVDLNSYEEIFIIKNSGNKDISDIYLKVLNQNEDTIEISFDKETYESNLYIDKLSPKQEKELFLKIIKNTNSPNFKAKHFDIIIY